MALINTSLPNLIQGVSQQPDALRYDGQCEEQENALSSIVDGLAKRPNTRHIARLITSAIASDSFVHFINRDDNEKYVVIHDGSKISVFDILTGAESTINNLAANYYVPTGGSYLDTATPRTALKALTIADSTFLVNTTKEVALGGDTSPSRAKDALVFIKQGDYQKKYGFDVEVTTNTGSNATIQFTSSVTGAYHKITNYNVSSGGTGFAVGDIVNVPLSSAKTITFENEDGDEYTYSNVPLTLLTQPTFKVTSVGTNGVITGIQIENQGRFRYATVVQTNYGNIYEEFGTGTDFTQNGPTSLQESFDIASTGSTAVSNSKVSLFKEYESQPSGTNNGLNADSSLILSNVGDLTNTTGLGHDSSGTVWNTYFDKDLNSESNVLVLKAKSGVVDFTIRPRDGLSGTGIGVIYKEVGSISDLPLVAKNGFEVKVVGDADLNQDDYYVRFETTGGVDIGQGVWVECVAPDLPLNYDSATLPFELVNEIGGFSLRPVKFADRVSGDDNSNPRASFVGQTIDNLFFFKNRLGFLCGENVIMSESGLGVLDSTGQLEFNFGRTTVTTLLDSDPIDVAVSSSRVTNLLAAKGFQENLVLFSENGQFVLKGGDVLTPKTVSITPITNFDVESAVDPLPLGSYLYFPFNRGNFTGLREFTVNATSDTYDSVDVTEHVPSYVPSNIIDMAGTTTEDMIALLSGDDSKSLYIYKYFWSGSQKVLSAWSKFTIEGDIRGIQFIDSTLYMVVTHNSETQLLEMPLESGLKDDAGYTTHLDQRIEATVLGGNDEITLPYTPADDSVQVYTKDGLKLTATNVGSTVTLAQPVSEDTDVWVGYPYTMKYTFSEQLFKASTGNSKSPSAASKLMVRNGALFFDDTAYFQVKVTPKARQTYVNTFTPDVVGSTTIGELNLDSGFYRFPVFTKAADTTITIENDSALPSNFQSAEFESFVHSRSNRYG